MSESGFRSLSSSERALLDSLLAHKFPGVSALREQLTTVQVRRVDSEGSLELLPGEGGPRAEVVQRVPVEGELRDRDGVMIHILLHVIDGLLKEMEVYREDSGMPQRDLDANELRILTLYED